MFTERGTLLKWLKKVEQALKDDTLVDVAVVRIDDEHVKLVFKFEGGAEFESGVLQLARGEAGEAATVEVGDVTLAPYYADASVENVGTSTHAVLNFVVPRGTPGEAGAQGAPGQAATITIGEVLTVPSDHDADVLNAGTAQNAIFDFEIPRGRDGTNGADGADGKGFADATEISMNDGEISLTIADGLNINGSFDIALDDGEILEIPSEMYIPVRGSESIVIDVDESGTFFDVHLDADITAKLARALVTPMSAPSAISLVAVDTANAQQMLSIGDGLTVENGTLKAAGGGTTVEANVSLTPSSVTDLTNTNWEIPSGWSAESQYGIFNISYTTNKTSAECNELYIGYTTNTFGQISQSVGRIVFAQSGVPLTAISTSADFTLNITGGVDVTNTNLISWLEAYRTSAPTTPLENLKIDSDIYTIPQPTPIEANPTTSPTADLTALKVGDTTYGIPSGGGGGGISVGGGYTLTYDTNNYSYAQPIYVLCGKVTTSHLGSGLPDHIEDWFGWHTVLFGGFVGGSTIVSTCENAVIVAGYFGGDYTLDNGTLKDCTGATVSGKIQAHSKPLFLWSDAKIRFSD